MENTNETIIDSVATEVIEEASKKIITVPKPVVFGIGVAATGGVVAAAYFGYKGVKKLIGWVRNKKEQELEFELDDIEDGFEDL